MQACSGVKKKFKRSSSFFSQICKSADQGTFNNKFHLKKTLGNHWVRQQSISIKYGTLEIAPNDNDLMEIAAVAFVAEVPRFISNTNYPILKYHLVDRNSISSEIVLALTVI